MYANYGDCIMAHAKPGECPVLNTSRAGVMRVMGDAGQTCHDWLRQVCRVRG